MSPYLHPAVGPAASASSTMLGDGVAIDVHAAVDLGPGEETSRFAAKGCGSMASPNHCW